MINDVKVKKAAANTSRPHAPNALADNEGCAPHDLSSALDRLPARLFHATIACNVPAIERDGLRSADALIEAAELSGPKAAAMRCYRNKTMSLPNGAALRDQTPMPPALLERCLDPSLTVRDWYDLVNARVYFWLDELRLARYLKASAVAEQIVYIVDTQALVERYADFMEVTPFNVGYAKRSPAMRGSRSFVTLRDWARKAWTTEAAPGAKPRANSHLPVEITARCSIPDFRCFVRGRRTVAAK
jgi:hypothetical protein